MLYWIHSKIEKERCTVKSKRFYAFLALTVLFNLAANFAHPVTPALIVERNLDSSMFGVAFAAMNVMNFLFAPLWGKLADYWSTRKILLISCLGYAAGQLIFMLAYSEWMIIFGRMFAGIFISGCYTTFANYSIRAAETDEQKSRNLTALETAHSMALAGGFFIGGMMGLVSTEFACFWQVVLLAVSGVLFFIVCRDQLPPHPQEKLELKEANPFRAFGAAKKCMTLPLALIFAVLAVSSIGHFSYEQCFNYYIKDQFGMSSAYNGTFKALIALVTLVLNSTVCIRMQRKTNINKSFLSILAVCTLMLGLILIWDRQSVFVAVYILYSSVNVIRLVFLQSMVAMRAAGNNSNTLMGFYQSMYSLGGIFGALSAGLIYKLDVMLPFVLAFAAYVLALVIGIFYRRVYQKESV